MNRKMIRIQILALAVLIGWALVVPSASGQTPAQRENAGIESAPGGQQAHKAVDPGVVQRMMRAGGFLLIPDSTTDTVGMYDPVTGDYQGDLINGSGTFITPINAILGPDGNIYVSDQSANSVFVFDINGLYLYTYADGTDGLSNVRGIAFRGNSLFVTMSNGIVAEFTGPHTRVADFITTGGGKWDVLFLKDNTCLCTSGDYVEHFDSSGVLIAQLFFIDFPEQVQSDTDLPGEYLVAGFTSATINDFEISGQIVESTPTTGSSRGVFRLGNGNLLSTTGSGVFELTPGTGMVVSQKFTGSCRFIEPINVSNKPSVDVKCNGGDAGVNIPSGTNAKIDVSVFAGTAVGIPVDIWIVMTSPFGPLSYNGTGPITGWNLGIGHAYTTGPLADVNTTALDRPVPLGAYKAHVGLDTVPNGSLDLGSLPLRDAVDFTVF